jgi:hypothetical protein
VCNDLGNHISYDDYLAAFSQTRIPVRWPTSAPDLEPHEDIWPTDRAPAICRMEGGNNEFTESVGLTLRLIGVVARWRVIYTATKHISK